MGRISKRSRPQKPWKVPLALRPTCYSANSWCGGLLEVDRGLNSRPCLLGGTFEPQTIGAGKPQRTVTTAGQSPRLMSE